MPEPRTVSVVSVCFEFLRRRQWKISVENASAAAVSRRIRRGRRRCRRRHRGKYFKGLLALQAHRYSVFTSSSALAAN